MRHLRYKNLKAITLIEVVVSIAVMATTAFMGALFVKLHEPGINLHQGAGEIRSYLQEARSLSLTYQTRHGIYFNIASSTMDLIELNGGTTIIKTIPLPERITFGIVGPFSGDVVSFNAAGAASESGMITITNTEGESKTITVNPSGYIEATN